jgi:hypothetical protein
VAVAWAAWVVWISKSNRSELKEKKGPAAMPGLSALAPRPSRRR